MSATSPAMIPDPRSAPPNPNPSSTSTSDSNTNANHDPVPSTLDPRTLATSAFTASLHSLGQNYTSVLVDRAQNLHYSSQALKNQEAQLARHTERLRKQNDSWEKVADEGRNALKEIGDLQNWAEMIERDLLIVEDVVGGLEREFEGELEGRGDLDEDGEHRMEAEGGEGEGDSGGEHGERGVNGDVNANVKMNGKVDREDVEESGKNKKGKGKQVPPGKKGWFSWLW